MKQISYYVLIALFIIQGCSGGAQTPNGGPGNSNQDDPATSVETYTVQSKDISRQIKSFGNIRAQEIIQVTPQVTNRITHVYAELGDTVQQGEVLAKIYDAQYRDQYQQAQSQLEQSRSSYVRDSLQFQRQKELYQRDLISSTEFENAKATFQNSKAQLQASRANLTESKENLENTKIKSPVYGVVLTRNISEGDLASSGEVAYEIANLVGYQTRVYLPLEEWRTVEIGQPVTFRVSNHEDISGRGRVTHISPRLDPATGLGEVVISLTERGGSIFQGVLVESTINVETHKNAVVIPRAALIENVQTFIEPESNSIQLERSYSAFVVQGDSIATKRDLKLGIEQGDQIEILQGIKPGEQIVITGQNSLEDSTRVQVAGQNAFGTSPGVNIDNDSNESGETQDSSSTS